jgi:hypothetical protein
MRHHDPRLRRLSFTLATAVTAIAVPAFAQVSDFGPRAPAAVYVEPAPSSTFIAPAVVPAPVDSSSAIQSGAGNAADAELADRVAAAIADDPRLDGATVTVAANNGRVSISGSAESPEQGPIAERVAREVAGPAAVSGTLSPLGG